MGKFSAGVVVALSVVDIVLNVLDIANVIEQCDHMCHELQTTIKHAYTSYFDSIKEASQKYRTAIGLSPDAIVLSLGPSARAASPSQLGLFSKREEVQEEGVLAARPRDSLAC